MFEELFKSHDSANPELQDQMESAKQQARIYGYLCEKMINTTGGPKAILHDVINMVCIYIILYTWLLHHSLLS